MTLEGKIAVDLELEGDRVREVRATSSRRVDACRALLGLPMEEALRSVPLLFSVCAEAQSVAAREACEAALGIAVAETEHGARQLRVACEAIDNHVFQLALKWPELFGAVAAVEPLRVLRQTTARLRAGEGEAGPEAVALGERLAALLGPKLPDSAKLLAGWTDGATTAQQTAAALLQEGLQDFGRCPVPLLPELPATWFAAQLAADPSFERAPRYRERSAEVGALARQREHPLVKSLLSVHGNGLLTRFVARLVDVEALGARVRTLAQFLRAPRKAAAAARSSGTGCSLVETSRGPLAHLVTIEEGRMVAWRVVAPTEWNFRPDGPLQAGLQGMRAQGLQRNAALLVTALDPCVGFEITVRGSGNA
jgi:uptake hydrogenase large subunit